MVTLSTLAKHFAMLSIFTGGFGIPGGPGFLNGNILFSVLAFGFLAASGTLYLNKWLFFGLFGLFAHGCVAIFAGWNSMGELLPIFVSTAVMYIVFYNIIRSSESTEDIVSLYLRYAEIICALVLFQFVMFWLGLRIGYDYSWFLQHWVLVPTGPFGMRPSGILFEPSQIGLTCSFAIGLSVARILGHLKDIISWRTVVVIMVASIISSSALAYFSIAVSFAALLLLFGWRSFLMLASAAFLLQQIDLVSFEPITDRFIGVYQLYALNDAQSAANSSSYTVFVHTQIAWQSFIESYWFGSGIGSHILSFDAYSNSVGNEHDVLQLNTAGNLLNRLVSELGLFGFLLLGLFVFNAAKHLVRFHTEPLYFLAAIAILPFLARNGTYAYFGLAFYASISMVKSQHSLFKQTK